jgi:tetratricopeptide (TPR) repeat protein
MNGLDRFEPGDLFGLARAYARRGRHEDALRIVDHALRPEAWSSARPAGASARRRLDAERARLLGRLGRREEAFAAWLEIARHGGPGAAVAWLHVASYREHVGRDVDAALHACREAAAVAGRARAWGAPMLAVERDLERRLPRLARLRFRRRPMNRAA